MRERRWEGGKERESVGVSFMNAGGLKLREEF